MRGCRTSVHERLTKRAGAWTPGAAAVTLAGILLATLLVLLARPHASPALTVPTIPSVTTPAVSTPTVTVPTVTVPTVTVPKPPPVTVTVPSPPGVGARASAGPAGPHAACVDPVRDRPDPGSVRRRRIASQPAGCRGNHRLIGTRPVTARVGVARRRHLIVFAVCGFVERGHAVD